MAARLPRPVLHRIAAEACRDPKTVEAVVAGAGNQQSRAAVLQAAQRLGMTLPPSVSLEESDNKPAAKAG